MKNLILLIIFVNIIFANNCWAITTEITVNYNLTLPLINDQIAINEIKTISSEYNKLISDSNNDSFNDELYNKLDLFIKNHKKSQSSLTALYMISGMCFFKDTANIYQQKGFEMLDYLINNYPNYVQGKISIIVKAISLENQGQRKEAIKLLEDKYEVILSIERDPYHNNFLEELHLNGTDNEFAGAMYYMLLSEFSLKSGEKTKAIDKLEQIVKLYPQTRWAKEAQEKLKQLESK